MYCIQCGKEIPDQARFCNYCGADQKSVQSAQERPDWQAQTTSQTRPSRQAQATSQARPSRQTQTTGQTRPPRQSQPERPKKSSGWGKRLVSLAAAVVVYLVARYGVAPLMFPDQSAPAANKKEVQTVSNSTAKAEDAGNTADEAAAADTSAQSETEQDSLWESHMYGVLYKDNTATYGPASMTLPDFKVVAGEDGSANDYLVSADGNNIFYVNYQFEGFMTSYDASDEQGILDSYADNQDITDVSMVKFEKSYLGDYPVIRYTVKGTSDGAEQYVTECIIMDQVEAVKSIRLIMLSMTEEASQTTDSYFDSLAIAPKEVTYEDTNTFGVGRITAK